MSTMNLAHERFIQQMILHGDRQKAYMFAYPGCSEASAYKSASRLLSVRKISDRIDEAIRDAQRQVEFELLLELKEKALRVSEQKALLMGIVTGKQTTTKKIVHYNREYELEVRPTIAQTLTAISLYMKLDQSWRRKTG